MIFYTKAAITVITVFGVFQLPCHGPVAWIAVLTIFQGTAYHPHHMFFPGCFKLKLIIFPGLAGMSFGFFLSTICNTSMDAIKMAIGACLPHMLLTGIIWPLEGMPGWMRSLVWYLPHTASVRGMRDIMLRGWGIGAASVLQGMAISSAWIILFLFLSWKLVKNKIH